MRCYRRFQFRTYEQNGLVMFNAGKASDFIAIELNKGKLYYTLNLGYGPISIKDTAPNKLSDNKWHAVTIGRPSRFVLCSRSQQIFRLCKITLD